VREARYTLAELEMIQAQAMRELGKLDFDVACLLSVQDNRVEVPVSDQAWFESELRRVGAQLPEGVEVVVVEGSHPETEHLLVGRSWRQAPDVDGLVLINDGVASPGQFVEIELTDTAGYDLVGRVVGPA